MKFSTAMTGVCLAVLGACGGKAASCPEGFVVAQTTSGAFCISAYEMSMTEGQLGKKDQGAAFPDGSTRIEGLVSAPGLRPTMTSWYQAFAACETQGWSLCTSEQWEDACDGLAGPGGNVYPSLDGEFVAGRCSIGDHRSNLSMPLTLTGEMPECRTPSGIFDMQGNLWEWVDSGARTAQGLPIVDKRGGGHYGAAPVKCSRHADGQHPPEWDGTIGFRCCLSL
ncbi:MAG: SUMF1/EgtB/PvdO family nonheme iron enzyme [Myxococcota bacterium]|nr:SUMF1/EgtB/PvdO family nonheme iron enzyme [Myxococcota bacterium]